MKQQRGCIGEEVESLGRADFSFSVAGTWATTRTLGKSAVPGKEVAAVGIFAVLGLFS